VRSGRLDAEEVDVVVGGIVGRRSPDAAAPAVTAARGQVAPAQHCDPCAAALLAPYPLVSVPLSGRACTRVQ
jgi:hypothetical protein